MKRTLNLVASSNGNKFTPPRWLQPDGEPVSCLEKLKVLNENLEEIRELSQEALEDAVLMGCDESQVREILAQLMDSLVNPYRKDGE